MTFMHQESQSKHAKNKTQEFRFFRRSNQDAEIAILLGSNESPVFVHVECSQLKACLLCEDWTTLQISTASSME